MIEYLPSRSGMVARLLESEASRLVADIRLLGMENASSAETGTGTTNADLSTKKLLS